MEHGDWGWLAAAATALAGGIVAVVMALSKSGRAGDRDAFRRQNVLIDRLEKHIDEQQTVIDRQNAHLSDCEVRVERMYGWCDRAHDWMSRAHSVMQGAGLSCGAPPERPPRPDPTGVAARVAADDFASKTAAQNTRLLKDMGSRVRPPEEK